MRLAYNLRHQPIAPAMVPDQPTLQNPRAAQCSPRRHLFD
jgi:hypothetical protein